MPSEAKIKKELDQAAEEFTKDSRSFADVAAHEPKKLADDASEESKKFSKEASKKFRDGENFVVEKLKSLQQLLSSVLASGAKTVSNSVSTLAVKTRDTGNKLYLELQNPLVAVNAVLGAGGLCALLHGYAEHHTRYLKGKSDSVILATVSGAAALLVLDGVLVNKYYSKFDKKKKL